MTNTQTKEELIRAALLAFCRGHVGTEDRYGRTCDERGCGICNASNPEEAAEYWYEDWMKGLSEWGEGSPGWYVPGIELPFDPNDEDEMRELIEADEEEAT